MRRTNYKILQEIEEDIVKKNKTTKSEMVRSCMEIKTRHHNSCNIGMGTQRQGTRQIKVKVVEEVKSDLNRAEIKEWKSKTRDRKVWRKVCEKI